MPSSAPYARRAEFGYLRETLGLTPGNLSGHLTVLEEAGMITVEKGYAGRHARASVRITPKGRTALAAELAALTGLLRRRQLAGKILFRGRKNTCSAYFSYIPQKAYTLHRT